LSTVYDFGVYEFGGYLPVLHIGPGFSIETYYIVISLAFSAALFWLVRRAEKRNILRNLALDVSLAVMIAGFLGARFLHVFFEEPAYYLEAPLRVLQFWRGGFVWYGGAIAGVLAGLWVLKRRGESFEPWLDLFAPLGAFGYALGRFACFLTGCCFGAVCTLPSGFQFRYPTQVFAMLWEFCVLGLLLWLESRKRRMAQGQLFWTWLALHAIGRIIMESFRGDPRGPAFLVSISTWISIGLFITAIFFYNRSRNSNRNRN
jgi:phosphatidylglycerol:prolipoprotein diacylglycerol transferase